MVVGSTHTNAPRSIQFSTFIFLLPLKLVILWLCVLSLHVCVPHICLIHPRRPGEGVRILGSGIRTVVNHCFGAGSFYCRPISPNLAPLLFSFLTLSFSYLILWCAASWASGLLHARQALYNWPSHSFLTLNFEDFSFLFPFSFCYSLVWYSRHGFSVYPGLTLSLERSCLCLLQW